MSARAFLDTNVLVYAFDDGEAIKQNAARRLLAAPDASFVISAQVIGEFYVAVTRKLEKPLDPSHAARAVDQLLRMPVVAIDGLLATAAVGRSQSSKISYWDALILEAARAGGAQQVLSEDLNPGQDYDGVTVVNPFAIG